MKECTCRDMLGALADYIDGEAAAELCAKIEEHLAVCPNCRLEVDTVRMTITLLHGTPKPVLPEAARGRLWQVLHLEDYLPGSKGNPK